MTNALLHPLVASMLLLARTVTAQPGPEHDAEQPTTAPREEPRDSGALWDRSYAFPLQLGVGRSFSIADHATTSSVYWSVALVATVGKLGSWTAFVGGGFGGDVLVYRQRDDRQAPDALEPSSNPGLDTRIGLARGTGLGDPRVTLKLTPQYAHVIEMDLVSKRRGLGFRASAGVACPRCWLPASDNVALAVFALFLPTELEYVLQTVPGETRHGVLVGWSL